MLAVKLLFPTLPKRQYWHTNGYSTILTGCYGAFNFEGLISSTILYLVRGITQYLMQRVSLRMTNHPQTKLSTARNHLTYLLNVL